MKLLNLKIPHSVLVLSAVALGLNSSCATQVQAESESLPECGPNCIDAAVGMPPGDDSVAVVTSDAGSSGVASDAEDSDEPATAHVAAICAGECVLQDKLACDDFEPDARDRRALYADVSERARRMAGFGVGSADAAVPAPEPAAPIPPPAADVGPVDGGGAGPSESLYSCQLDVIDGEPKTGCALRGTAETGEYCSSSRDCMPGLGCVGGDDAAECLPFCCEEGTECGDGRHCAERPLRSDKLSFEQAIAVPVCVTLEPCAVGEELRCRDSEEVECKCPLDAQCSVVDETGATSCVELGPGRQGDDCPCDAGYFCSPATNSCIKFCRVEMEGECGEQLCQQAPNFPDGWGLCVGADPEAADPRARRRP